MRKGKQARRIDQIVELSRDIDPRLDVTVIDEAIKVAAARGSAYVFAIGIFKEIHHLYPNKACRYDSEYLLYANLKGDIGSRVLQQGLSIF